jgi:hypothetical protein
MELIREKVGQALSFLKSEGLAFEQDGKIGLTEAGRAKCKELFGPLHERKQRKVK